MKTKEQELADLEKDTAQKRAEIESKHAVLSQLPKLEGYAPPFIHHGKLYGTVGSIHYWIQRYTSIAEGKSPDVALLRELLTAFTPQDVILVKDGCTSFRPEPDSFTSNGEVTDVDPIIIQIDPNQFSQNVTVCWYGKIGSDLWLFKVEFPMHPFGAKVGKLDLRYNRYAGGNGEISSVDVCHFHPSNYARVIRWASGDRKNTNTFTVYWERGRNINIPDMLEK